MKPFQSAAYTLMMAPAASSTAVRTASIDISSSDYVTINVAVSAELNTNSTNVTLALARGDDGTNFTTISTTLLDNTAAAQRLFHVNPVGKGRFLRVTLTPGTVATNDAVFSSVVAILDPANKGTPTGIVIT